MNSQRIKKLAVIAMLCAISYIVSLFAFNGIMPGAPYLKLEAKDAVIVVSGFIFGPLACLAITFVTALFEMISPNGSGAFGMMMNVMSSASFACIAAVIYRKKKTYSRAVIGLICGVITMTAVMMLWNYTMTPLYSTAGITREEIAPMLTTVFLPFNLLKGTINAAIALVLYKPVITALRKARLIPKSKAPGKKSMFIGTFIISVVVITTCVLIILALNGII